MKNAATFLGFLALIFIGLKLAEVGAVAAWSWWIVLSPLWGPAVLVIAIAIWYSITGYRWHR